MKLTIDLQRLCVKREKLTLSLAPTLRRPGPHYPGDRNAEDKRRRNKRNEIRTALQANADAIVKIVMDTYQEPK